MALFEDEKKFNKEYKKTESYEFLMALAKEDIERAKEINTVDDWGFANAIFELGNHNKIEALKYLLRPQNDIRLNDDVIYPGAGFSAIINTAKKIKSTGVDIFSRQSFVCLLETWARVGRLDDAIVPSNVIVEDFKNWARQSKRLIHFAIESDDLKVLEILLEKYHISPNGFNGKTSKPRANVSAINKGDNQWIEIMEKAKSSEMFLTPLQYAATLGKLNAVQLLLEWGANPNQRGMDSNKGHEILLTQWLIKNAPQGKGNIDDGLTVLKWNHAVNLEDHFGVQKENPLTVWIYLWDRIQKTNQVSGLERWLHRSFFVSLERLNKSIRMQQWSMAAQECKKMNQCTWHYEGIGAAHWALGFLLMNEKQGAMIDWRDQALELGFALQKECPEVLERADLLGHPAWTAASVFEGRVLRSWIGGMSKEAVHGTQGHWTAMESFMVSRDWEELDLKNKLNALMEDLPHWNAKVCPNAAAWAWKCGYHDLALHLVDQGWSPKLSFCGAHSMMDMIKEMQDQDPQNGTWSKYWKHAVSALEKEVIGECIMKGSSQDKDLVLMNEQEASKTQSKRNPRRL